MIGDACQIERRKQKMDGNSGKLNDWQKLLPGKEKTMGNFREFLREEDGMGVVEVILIIVILISLAILFKTQITSLVNKILNKISTQAGKVYN